MDEWMHEQRNQTTNESINQSLNQSTNQPIKQMFNRESVQFTNHAIIQSVTQWILHWNIQKGSNERRMVKKWMSELKL